MVVAEKKSGPGVERQEFCVWKAVAASAVAALPVPGEEAGNHSLRGTNRRDGQGDRTGDEVSAG